MTKKSPITIRNVLWLILVVFIIFITFFFAPIFQEKRAYFPVVAILALIFLILGIVLIVLTIKQKLKGKKKLFPLLTGISALSPVVFAVLHNLFDALAKLAQDIALINYPVGFLSGLFFIIAVLIAPLAFIVCEIISLILFKKEKR